MLAVKRHGGRCQPCSPRLLSPQLLSHVSVSKEEAGKVGGRRPGGAAGSVMSDTGELERRSLALLATRTETSAPPDGRPCLPGPLAAYDGEYRASLREC